MSQGEKNSQQAIEREEECEEHDRLLASSFHRPRPPAEARRQLRDVPRACAATSYEVGSRDTAIGYPVSESEQFRRVTPGLGFLQSIGRGKDKPSDHPLRKLSFADSPASPTSFSSPSLSPMFNLGVMSKVQ